MEAVVPAARCATEDLAVQIAPIHMVANPMAAVEAAVDTVAQLLKRTPEPAWMRMDNTSTLST